MKEKTRLNAIFQALFVTLLWSSSWVIIKLFIHTIPPLTFAGLRFSIAFLVLLPGLMRRRSELSNAQPRHIWLLLLLGIVYYTLTQGTQFITLRHLPSVTFSLMLSFTSPLVAIAGIYLLKEKVFANQWAGTAIFLVGAVVYFSQTSQAPAPLIGLLLGTISMLTNAGGSILGRAVNKTGAFSPLTVSAVGMGVGAAMLLAAALVTEGLPRVSAQGWLAILWLSVVNTAFAYWVWNRSLQVLTALESSLINNTMLIQISLLAWLFLDERLTALQVLGLILAFLGSILVNIQFKPNRRSELPAE